MLSPCLQDGLGIGLREMLLQLRGDGLHGQDSPVDVQSNHDLLAHIALFTAVCPLHSVLNQLPDLPMVKESNTPE